MNRIFGTTMTLAALFGVATLSVAQAQNAKPVSTKPAPAAKTAKLTDTVGSVNGKPVTWQMLFNQMKVEAKFAPPNSPDPIVMAVGQVVAEKITKGVFGTGTTSITMTQSDVLNALKTNTPAPLNVTLTSIMRDMALDQEAAKAGIKADTPFVDAFITNLLKQLRSRNPAMVGQTDEQFLASQNITRAALRPRVRWNAIASALVRKDAEKQLGHPYSGADFVKARHILIAIKPLGPEAKADEKLKAEQEALDKIKVIAADIRADKKQFDVAARELSDDTSAKQNSGELGTFARGLMVPAFEEAAFKMKTGEISEPIKTQFGYHIIQVQTASADLKPEEWNAAVDTIVQQRTMPYVNELIGTKAKVINNLRSQPQMGMMPQGGGRPMPRPNAPR